MESVRCLVIGGNGFIGSHLVDELAEAGYVVRAFDTFSRPPQFRQRPEVEVFKGDVFNAKSIEKALVGVAYVFHSLSLTTPFISDNDPYIDIEKNLKPTVRIFEQCVQAKIKKVMFISSGGAVYGPVAEDTAPAEGDATTPVSPYGINKLAIENYLSYFNRKFGLKYLVFRLSNPYGPRQVFRNSQGVIPAFLQQIVEQKRLTVLGDGTASRDYIYIRDATKMMTQIFARRTKHRTYNLGSGRQTTLNHIIAALRKVVDQKFKVVHEEAPKTFLKSARINVDRLTNEFGISATTTLVQGLRETVHPPTET